MQVGPTLPTGDGAQHGAAGRGAGRPAWWIAAAALLVAGLAGAVRRVVVAGPSMAPTLLAGDRLVVVRVPPGWPLRPGDLVAVADPAVAGDGPDPRRRVARVLVKRLVSTGGGSVEVAGDDPARSTDSRQFGPLPRRSVVGLVVYRYAPPGRTGSLVGRSGGRPRPRPL